MSTISIPCSVTQRQFLDAVLNDDTVDMVGFGGARGGGKTMVSCLAMVLRRLKYANTRGLMLRRTQSSADQSLKNEIEKVLGLLGIPRGGVRYRVHDRTYIFPNGSTILLGYCQNDEDYTRYLGVEYADIAWEELTQNARANFDRVNGSNRSNNAACRPKIWATCNPGGIGHGWVKEMFVDAGTRNGNVLFIQSLIKHNLASLEQDPGYVKRVLDPLPDWQRAQWRDGNWEAIAGAYFEINPAQVIKRDVPYWASWYGGVDWGRVDPFSVVYLAKWQDWEGRNHAHLEVEIYKPGLHLDEQAEKVHETEESLRTIQNANFHSVIYYADPSVAKATEGLATEAGRTIRSTWANHDFYVLPAHTNARVPGWQLLRYLLYKGILTISPNCRALLSELRSAVYEGTKSGGEPTGEDIDKNCKDHALDACLVPGTLIATERGDVKIEDVVVGDRVWTRKGLRPVTGAACTGRNRLVWTVQADNGAALCGTGNHPVFVEGKGFVPIAELRNEDMCITYRSTSTWKPSPLPPVTPNSASKKSSIAASFIAAIPTPPAPATASIFARARAMGARLCTAIFGPITTARSRPNITSTIGTATPATTLSPTWNASRLRNTKNATETIRPLHVGANNSKAFVTWQRSGTGRRQAVSGIANTRSKAALASLNRACWNAITATNSIRAFWCHRLASALTTANRLRAALSAWTMKNEPVLSASPNSPSTGTAAPILVPVRVDKISASGTSDVYNLSVGEEPEYFANGILVHNCRYAIVSTFGLGFAQDLINPYHDPSAPKETSNEEEFPQRGKFRSTHAA